MARGERKEEGGREAAHAGEDGRVSESRREGGAEDLCSVSCQAATDPRCQLRSQLEPAGDQ